MQFGFTEEQEELRDMARAFLEEQSGSESVRSAMESELGYHKAVWERIATELGWPAILIPEEYGGLGLGFVELVALLEETGAALLCSPLFSSVCLGGNALLLGGSEAQKQEFLPRLAEGELTATLAYTEANGRWDASGVQALARKEGDGFVLSGSKSYVPDGHSADLLVVAARSEGSQGEEGISLFLVPADAKGLARKKLATMDQTRSQAEISLNDVQVPASALMGDEGTGWSAISQTLDQAVVGLAAEQLGGAQRCLDSAVQYAKERIQFGRPIGSFQAIKHKCADMMVRVESARSATYYAAWAAAEGEPDLPVLASLAKAYCSDAYFQCAAESLQIHGGVGFTWEYDVHLYFKRAKSSETFLGDAAYHRERVAKLIGI